jgi:IS30 family transposase
MKQTTRTYAHLSYEERFTIEKLLAASVSLRTIAKFLNRSPNTIAREVHTNSVKNVYGAGKAHGGAYVKRWRSKRQCLKIAMDMFLRRFVEKKLTERWSPEQISGYLRREMDIVCSTKAIYKFAGSRCLQRRLFGGGNRRKSGRKRYRSDTPKEGRTHIDERPVAEGPGHYEMDFIVSKESTWVLLVVVDRVTKHATVLRLPNRKRTTIPGALSDVFRGISVNSITTDNDIAFAWWKTIESLLHTRIYVTHPYHSWEKGRVENTNRWIRCFVPKKRDIASVTQEELDALYAFLNDRPRKIIGFRTPFEYHRILLAVS